MGRKTWRDRWTILRDNLVDPHSLNDPSDDDDTIGSQLDTGHHPQEVSEARFGDKDLVSQGGLPGGQFGEIDVALCRIDNALYVRKAQPRRQALQATRERDVLLRARRTGSVWSPHLLCAFKDNGGGGGGLDTYTLVMSYVPGGTLEDVLESCLQGGMAESDVRWWFAQAVCAIGWLHEQGWAHRDIKPSNLAITSTKHLQLLDFGCAAPLSLSQSPNPSNSPPRRILPYDDCLVPCGTCDYLSPEVLIWHETALARARNANNAGDEESEDDTWAQEWSEDIDVRSKVVDKLRRSVNGHGGNQTAVGDIGSAMGDILEGYGPETDWWSLGAMVYELTYGVAPFFAPDVPTTYQKVLNHKASLRFPAGVGSSGLESVLRGLLTRAEKRLGRRSVQDIKDHPYFQGVDWEMLHMLPASPSLVTPQFTYAPPVLDQSGMTQEGEGEGAGGGGFAFSALFQSTMDESATGLHGWVKEASAAGRGEDQNGRDQESRRLTLRPGGTTVHIQSDDEEEQEQELGKFTWGPPLDAFDHAQAEDMDMEDDVTEDVGGLMAGTPFRLKVPATPARAPLFGLPTATPMRAGLPGTTSLRVSYGHGAATPFRKVLGTPFQQLPMVTPFRQTSAATHRQTSATPYGQTSATPFRQSSTTPWRPNHAPMLFKTPLRPGASAFNRSAVDFGTGGSGTLSAAAPGTGTVRRTRAVTEAEAFRQVLASARKRVYLKDTPGSDDSDFGMGSLGEQRNGEHSRPQSQNQTRSSYYSELQNRDENEGQMARPLVPPIIIPGFDISMSSSESSVPVPPSPSPSPRPGSALSRRSATPSAMMTMTFGAATPSAMYSRSGSRLSVRATTPTWTGGRASRREDSDEEEEEPGARRERRERAERERRARLEKEREKARKEETARLERQRQKGKGREMDGEREGEKGRQVQGKAESQEQEREEARRRAERQELDRKELERQAQLKLEQERRRLEKRKEVRRREDAVQQDQEVEAARLHELRLAEEMARMDEAKRRQQERNLGERSHELDDRREQNQDRTGAAQTHQASEMPRLAVTSEPTGRRRVKSANQIPTERSQQPMPKEHRQERGNRPRENVQAPLSAPPLKTRTLSHNEPLLSTTLDTDRPRPQSRIPLDDVVARQKQLVHDVDMLQSRINDFLRALQAGQT
ncbi:kinase-like protein [Ceratobasidium sp. AG-I]|nr:kinase-like protein [Ceratobasidium sp. AG-I]